MTPHPLCSLAAVREIRQPFATSKIPRRPDACLAKVADTAPGVPKLTGLVLRVLVSTSHAFPGVRNLALGDSEDDRRKELEKGRKTAHDAGSKAAEDREAADGNGRRGEGEGGGEARSQRKQGAGDGGHGEWIVFKE